MRFIILVLMFFVHVLAHPNEDISKPIRIGLALSGGGALGIAHVGVLKVLEQENIPINYIAGNSMGSLIGGFYAAGLRAAQIESILINANWTKLFGSEIPFGAQYLPERQQSRRYVFQLRHHNFIPSLPSGLVPIQNVEFLLMKFLSKIEYNSFYDFDSLPIPYRAVAVDLKSGKKYILKKGRLAQAIRSSIAIPGIFAPVEINDREYVDGGVIQNLPVDPLFEFEPDLIIASLTMKNNPETDGSLIDIILRSINLVGIDDLEKQKQLADILIEPNVDQFRNSDFHKVKTLIEVGEKAARQALPEIRKKIAERTIVNTRRPITVRPLPIISSIEFKGLEITKNKVVRGKMRLRKGDYLDFDCLITDLMNIYNTNFFDNIDYDLRFNNRKDSVKLIVKFQEKAFGFYALGVRYDNFDNVNLGIEVGQGNIKGSGADIRAAFNLGNPNEIRFGLTGTRLYRFPLGYRIDGFWRSIQHPIYNNIDSQPYKMNLQGGVIEAGYILGKDAFFNFGLNGYKVSYTDKPLQFATTPNKQWIIGPLFRIEFNNLNDIYFPTRGITYQINGFYSSKKLKASEDFWKLSYFSEQIIPLSQWFFVHPRLEIGISNGNLALSEYYRTGGLNFIGFEINRFTAPQKIILNNSFDFKLFQIFNQNNYPFYLQIFSTIATFEKYNNLINGIDFKDDFRWSVGIGIKTNTPIGPLQLSVGLADFGKNKEEPKFCLSVGREFRYSEE